LQIQDCFAQIINELQSTLAHISNDEGEELAKAIIEARRVFVAGAGRSGLIVRGFAMRLMHLGFTVHIVGDTTTPNITSDDILLIGSGSGSTGSLVVMAQKAQVIGAGIALITIRENSPIGQLADIVLPIPAPSPKIEEKLDFHSVQPMGALFEQNMSLTLDALIMILMSKTNSDSDTMFSRHANLE